MNCPYTSNLSGSIYQCISPGNPATQNGTKKNRDACDYRRCATDEHINCPHYRNAQINVDNSRPNYCPHCGKAI